MGFFKAITARFVAGAIGFTLAVGAMAQSPAPAAPAFEVVSIKPAPPGEGGSGCGVIGPGCRKGGEWTANASVLDIIQRAWDVTDAELVGAPDWTATTRFDFIAKVSPQVPYETFRQMQQTMLADRFHLVAHRETRQIAAVPLHVASGGARLKPSAGLCLHAGALFSGYQPDATEPCGHEGLVPGDHGGAARIVLRDISLPEMLKYFFHHYERSDMPPYLDETGLTGRFDIELVLPPIVPVSATDLAGGRGVGSLEDRPQREAEIQKALHDQLGLDIDFRQPIKMPFKVLVIDHLTLPTAD